MKPVVFGYGGLRRADPTRILIYGDDGRLVRNVTANLPIICARYNATKTRGIIYVPTEIVVTVTLPREPTFD